MKRFIRRHQSDTRLIMLSRALAVSIAVGIASPHDIDAQERGVTTSAPVTLTLEQALARATGTSEAVAIA